MARSQSAPPVDDWQQQALLDAPLIELRYRLILDGPAGTANFVCERFDGVDEVQIELEGVTGVQLDLLWHQFTVSAAAMFSRARANLSPF